jgi:hypothetical protein
MRRALRHACLTGVLALSGTVVAAQTAQFPLLAAAKLEPVVVRGNYDNAVGTSDAASQGSVTSRLIESRPTLRPAEVLEFVPGVIVSQHSGDGKANQYYLRGFNLDHGTDFATFVGGMPVNMPAHAHGQGYSDLNWLIPELVDRIDYRKGPYYAEEGDFSSAGSARIRLFDSLPRGVASLTLGAHNYERLLVADSHSSAVGPGRWLYALEAARNDGPWDNPERFHRLNGVLRYGFGNAQNRSSLTAMAYSAGWRSTDQIPQRAVDQGLIGRFGTVDPTDGGRTARYSLSYDFEHRGGDGTFKLNAYAIQSRLDLYSNFTYFLADPVNGDQFEQAERRRVFGLASSRSWSGALAGRDTTNTIGIQLRHDRLDPVGLYGAVGGVRSGTVQESRVRQTSVGLHAENATQWTAWLRSVAGLRFDHYDFDVASSIAANSGSRNAAITSPKLSLIFGPWHRTEYFVNYGHGFHSNDARGTTARVAPRERLPLDPVDPLVRSKDRAAHRDRPRAAKLAGGVAVAPRLRAGLRGRRRRHVAEPAEQALRHRMEQSLPRRAVAAARRRPGAVAGAFHRRRCRRQPHSRLGRPGRLARRDGDRPRRLVGPAAAALFRAAAADRGRQPALAGDDAGLRAGGLQDHPGPQARARRVQPVRPQGERHRLLLRLAPEGRAGRGSEGRPFPPGRAAQRPAHADGEFLRLPCPTPDVRCRERPRRWPQTTVP